MRKLNFKLLIALGLSSGFMMTAAHAEDITGDANVTVSNTLNIAQDQTLSFGTISATYDDLDAATATATLKIPADPAAAAVVTAATPASANIIQIAPGQPAKFSISGAAPEIALQVDFTTGGTGIVLTDPAGGGDTFTFTMDSYYSDVNGDGASYSKKTDATGALSFYLGSTLSTTQPASGDDVAGVKYNDSTYTGSYTVSVTY